MTTCPHCNGPLEDTPCGDYCEICRWYFADDLGDVDPGPALPIWIEPAPTPGAFRIGTGWVSPWNGDRPR